jgi:hypothetical protein
MYTFCNVMTITNQSLWLIITEYSMEIFMFCMDYVCVLRMVPGGFNKFVLLDNSLAYSAILRCFEIVVETAALLYTVIPCVYKLQI